MITVIARGKWMCVRQRESISTQFFLHFTKLIQCEPNHRPKRLSLEIQYLESSSDINQLSFWASSFIITYAFVPNTGVNIDFQSLFFCCFYFFFFIVVGFVIHWNESAMDLHVFPSRSPLLPPSIETCILSRVKQITSPGWMHETSAWTWCTG